MNAAQSITAIFNTTPSYALTINKSGAGTGTVTSNIAGINCGTDCTENYTSGTNVTLTAAAAVGSTFSGWTGGNCGQSSSCTIAMTAAQNITASFIVGQTNTQLLVSKAGNGTVSSSNVSGIQCGNDCSEEFNLNQVVTLTAAPDSGWQFAGWNGACSMYGTSLICTITMSDSKTVSASFTERQVPKTLTVNKIGSGVVMSSPTGVNCGEDCSEIYNSGTIVTLITVPTPGWQFAGWSGTGINCTGQSCQVTLNNDININATFNEIAVPVALTVTKTGNGRIISETPAGIDCGSDCDEQYARDTAVILRATADVGWQFSGWAGACTGTGSCALTLNTDAAVGANFTLIPIDQQTLSLTVTGPGSITSQPAGIVCGQTCSAPFNSNSTVTLTAVPNVGTTFIGWGGACVNETGLTCRVNMNEAQTVTGTFNTASSFPVATTVIGKGRIVSTPDGVNCTGICVNRFATGQAMILTAQPADGWQFVEWTGACTGSDANCLVTVNQALTVAVKFEPAPLDGQLLNVITVGNGSVNSSPVGIDCGINHNTCEALQPTNSDVILTATAADNETQFIGWGGACVEYGTEPTCIITMNEARLAVAAFGGFTVQRESTAWQVAEIYLATMGYSPDSEGLSYWVNNIDTLPQWTPETVAQSFFDQTLVQLEYPAAMTNGEFIDAVYRNIFGRGADEQGYSYWLNEMDQGHVLRNQIIIAFINGGWANPSPDAQSDMLRFKHRIEVSLAFVEYQAQHGILYTALSFDDQLYLRQVGSDILLIITADEMTRDAAIASIATLLAPLHD
ncbi:DUF4214 domain-containing protein [Rhodoferax sp. 4810]|nr:DUF4214 domain-containing protein [Rhodoferax jenense]